ncbi:D-alanine--D-alanine ligase [Helicobacter mesocricetorum]|uniref:D-alanine--D-alanine ligase n=1 Tax=Helicobacter mesocricetorum TaxID=87012 RepID=UPI000CF061E7|nr:D-alanine--D-alanine ligase [Helicobacter mesocricetorum]
MNLCLLFGGKTYEHEISIVSAIALKKLLLNLNFFIFLDDRHCFYLIPADKMQSKFFSSKAYQKEKQIYPKQGGFFYKTLWGEKPLELPVILNLIHGFDGEDGVIASLLEFYNIPFIGPRNPACVLSCDKELTKIYAKSRGIPTLDYKIFYKGDTLNGVDYPLIIKPARLGSSLGIAIAKSQEELQYALEQAFEYDDKVVIEPFFNNIKEYNLAGYKAKDGMHFSFIEEPQKKEILDFEKKYLDFARTQQTKEADINEALKQSLQEAFQRIYENCFEGALIRCDFFVRENEVYLNEINPIPGSLANYLFQDFYKDLQILAQNLPTQKDIKVSYEFLHKIHFAKGK